jgi:probable HAF family extracellular repeat protein
VVGYSQDLNANNTVAWLWKDGVMTELNTLIPSDSPLFLVEALGINDRGQITGYAFDTSTGEAPAFLATPVDDGEDSAGVARRSAGTPLIVLPENLRQRLQRRMGFRQHWPEHVAPRN